MLSLDYLRNFRTQLHYPITFNSQGDGIALFDLIISFVVAFLLDKYVLKLKSHLVPIYYLSVVPIGIAIHAICRKPTFLNEKIMMSDMNIYKSILVVMLSMIVYHSSMYLKK